MKNLTELRKNEGLTQRDMAKIAGVSPQVYCHYENDRVTPPLDSLEKFADYFKVSIDYLVGRESEDGRIINAAPQLPADEQELLDGYRQMNSAAKSKMQGYMQGILSAPGVSTIRKA